MCDFSIQELAAIAIALDDEEEERKRKRLWVHPMLRDKSEGEFYTLYPHLIDDETKFLNYFRMPIRTFEYILSKIEWDIQKETTYYREAITSRERLAVCLRFLATGDSYKSLAYSYRLGHSTVQSIVVQVCDAIVKNLMAEALPVPCEEDWKKIADQYWTNWNFPNCIDALDGKRVVIESPANSGSLYFSYKNTFSVVLLALVDANYRFIWIDVRSYGKNRASGIDSTSTLCKNLDKNKLNVPNDVALPGTNNVLAPYVIVGDEAFPLKRNLMRPYPGSQTEHDEHKRIFNYRLSRARRMVECAFGILAQTFRLYLRKLKATPCHANTIITTTCILHILIHPSNVAPPDATDMPSVNQVNLRPMTGRGGNATREAFAVRETLKNYFSSYPGSVDWQNQKI